MSTYDEETGLQQQGDVSDDEAPEGVPLLAKVKEEQAETLEETGGTDVVQFSAPMYFSEETEGLMTVDIIRLGSMKGKVAVNYSCKDGSAKESLNYTGMSGQLVFADGEHTKSIDIPIMDDGLWTPTNEFSLVLDSQQNCSLGAYLLTSRVKIMNTNKFPSEVYEKDIEEGVKTGSMDHIFVWSLFWEFWKSHQATLGLKWQTVLVLVMDQLSNILLFGTL